MQQSPPPITIGSAVRLIGQYERGQAYVRWSSAKSGVLLIEFSDGCCELVESHHLVLEAMWQGQLADALEGRR